jgi:hypothetical protein
METSLKNIGFMETSLKNIVVVLRSYRLMETHRGLEVDAPLKAQSSRLKVKRLRPKKKRDARLLFNVEL